MIKIANNLINLMNKHASASPVAPAAPVEFVNYSDDEAHPAFAVKGESPQSYYGGRESEAFQYKDKNRDRNIPLSAQMSPQEYATRLNTGLGQDNSSRINGESFGNIVQTSGAYGPTRMADPKFGLPIPKRRTIPELNGGQTIVRHRGPTSSSYGYGDLYNMSQNQIDNDPEAHMLSRGGYDEPIVEYKPAQK